MAVITFIKGIEEGFKEFGLVVGALINFILLSLVYLLGVGITFLFAKISGKDFLGIKNQKDKKSYYESLNLSKESKENYYRQF